MALIVLPWVDRRLSPNARTHWSVKAKATKVCRKLAYYETKKTGITIDWDGDIHLWIDFYPPDKRSRDDDNLLAAFKAYRDGMADALGVDDKRVRSHPFVRDEVQKGGQIIVKITPGPDYG